MKTKWKGPFSPLWKPNLSPMTVSWADINTTEEWLSKQYSKTMATLEENLKNMRVYFKSGKTKEASWRKSQLKGLRRFLLEKEEDIFKALMQDLGKHRIEAFRDEVCYIYNYFLCYLYITIKVFLFRQKSLFIFIYM